MPKDLKSARNEAGGSQEAWVLAYINIDDFIGHNPKIRIEDASREYVSVLFPSSQFDAQAFRSMFNKLFGGGGIPSIPAMKTESYTGKPCFIMPFDMQGCKEILFLIRKDIAPVVESQVGISIQNAEALVTEHTIVDTNRPKKSR